MLSCSIAYDRNISNKLSSNEKNPGVPLALLFMRV